MATPCFEQGCGVVLSITDDGALRADAVLDPDDCNGIVCVEGKGLLMSKPQSVVQAGTMPEDGLGWTADLTDLGSFPVGVFVVVAESDASSNFTNESACLTENMASTVTAREVRYDGDAVAQFEVDFEVDEGAGYNQIFNIVCDFRWPVGPPGGIADSRPGGSRADGRVLAASGVYAYRYRIRIKNLVDPGVGPAMVTSPGLTFVHLAATN